MHASKGGRVAARGAALLAALAMLLIAGSASAQAGISPHTVPPLEFGVYAGGMIGTPTGMSTGPADDPVKVQSALNQLQGLPKPFLVRAFTAYVDQPAGTISPTLPDDVAQYAVNGRKVDLVLGYDSTSDGLGGWEQYVRDQVHHYGASLGTVQITEEPDFSVPSGPNEPEQIRQAVVAGVIAADEQLRADGLADQVQVGMSVAEFGQDDTDFWQGLARYVTPAFHAALDYVGVDSYPDVFVPGDVSDQLTSILTNTRQQLMPIAGLGSDVPIHVAESGWPTGPDRTEAQQVSAIDEGVRTVNDLRGSLNITVYELFDLRDADSTIADMWEQFGILHSDYTPKPAFETYRELIALLGVHAAG